MEFSLNQLPIEVCLQGHACSISCLAFSSGLLASGSEDKTLRLWDIATFKAIRCYHRCFNDAVEFVQFHNKNFNILIAASGDDIMCFDLRSSDRLIQTSAAHSLIGIIPEISCMSISQDGMLLAVGDGSGHVHIIPIDSASGKMSNSVSDGYKIIENAHANIVGIVYFQTINEKEYLLSGGFDCTISCWDLSESLPRRSGKIEFSNDMNSMQEAGSKTQLVNPPFIYGISKVERSSDILVGLGDGTIRVLHSCQLNPILELENAHNNSISCISSFNNTLLSAGLDDQIIFWDVTTKLKVSKNRKGGKLRSHIIEKLTVSYSFKHSSKINALCIISHTLEKMQEPTTSEGIIEDGISDSLSMQSTCIRFLVVGDTSGIITFYHPPSFP